MLTHVVRILRSDLRSWLPIIVVVGLVTVLVGVCMNQFIWTNSSAFVETAVASGLDPAEFAMVSVTIYVLVAVLAFFTLTVVGSATVERTRNTFAQWRLAGATPRQVRISLWTLIGVASVAGALPGSLVSLVVNAAAVLLFNQMAAQSFPGGLGDFDPPPFSPSLLAWAASFLLGVATCAMGAYLPARRAARVRPVETVRGLAKSRRHGTWLRWTGGSLLLLAGGAMAGAGMLAPQAADVGVTAGAMVNAAISAGLVAAGGIYVLGPELIPVVLAIVRAILRPIRAATVGVLATRAARANAETNANMIAPLAAAVGLAGMVFTVLRSYLATMSRAGFLLSAPNYSDTFIMTGLFGFVSLLTSIAVITLSGRDAIGEQAILRTAGMTPRQVTVLMGWQSFLLTLTAAVFAVIPIMIAGIVLISRSTLLVGHPILDIPWAGLAAALLVCWGALFLVQWTQVASWVRREAAISLRRASSCLRSHTGTAVPAQSDLGGAPRASRTDVFVRAQGRMLA